jgi:solute:Na+ symporter, SSS family
VLAQQHNIPLSLLGWVSGSMAIWSALFAEGNYLYGRMLPAVLLTLVFVVTGTILVWVVSRTFAATPSEATTR